MIFRRKFTRTGALNPALRSHDQLTAAAADSPNGALEREGSVSCCRISRPRFVTCNALSVMRSMLTGPNFIICAGRDPRAGPKLFPTYRPATPGASNRFPATASSPRLALREPAQVISDPRPSAGPRHNLSPNSIGANRGCCFSVFRFCIIAAGSLMTPPTTSD
jgi:hypothetical protein